MDTRSTSAAPDPTIVSVRGSSVVRRSPELATAHIGIEFDGDERSSVIERARTTQAVVSAGLGEHDAPSDGVVAWSAPQLRVWEARPWSQQGEQLPLVHHAAATLDAVFDDRERLAAWLTSISGVDGVAVHQLDWTLSDDTRLAVETEALAAAVADARRRADTIASALGFLTLRPIAISDPGLLSADGIHTDASDAMSPRVMKAASAPSSNDGVVLEPDDVEIEVVVHARFATE